MKKDAKFHRLWKAQAGLCWLCDQTMMVGGASFDHIIPRSAGGGNGIANLKLAHVKCNRIRKSVPADQAREFVQQQLREPPKPKRTGRWLRQYLELRTIEVS